MASEGNDSQELTEATHEPRECMACRGTGRVISNLGGTPSTVSCPWCSGSGLRPAEIDAQEHWGEGQASSDHAAGDADSEAPSAADSAS